MTFDEPLLDRDILNENTMNDPSLQEELFYLFFGQAKLYIEQLEAAIAEDSLDDWKMTTHGIKGASRSLGFTRLASLALTAESEAPSTDRFVQLRDTINETNVMLSMSDAA